VLAEGVQQCRKKSLKANVYRLVLGSTVYNIWRNRNELKHGTQHKTDEQILCRELNGKLELG
jgi:hypothetical protein